MTDQFLVALKGRCLFASLAATSDGHIGFTEFNQASMFHAIRHAEQVARLAEQFNRADIEVLTESEARQRLLLVENELRYSTLHDERFQNVQLDIEKRRDKCLRDVQ